MDGTSENIYEWIPYLLYYFLHIGLRLLSYAFLAAYYLYFAAIVLPLQIISNFLIERYACVLKDLRQNLTTAALALVVPACGIEKDDKRTRKFCRWNCITFAINLAISTTILNLLSFFEVTHINDLPYSISGTLGLEPLQVNVMGWGSLSVIAVTVSFSVLSGVFANWKWSCIHGLQAPFDRKVTVVKKKAKAVFCKKGGDTLPDGNESEMQKMNAQPNPGGRHQAKIVLTLRSIEGMTTQYPESVIERGRYKS